MMVMLLDAMTMDVIVIEKITKIFVVFVDLLEVVIMCQRCANVLHGYIDHRTAKSSHQAG